jgi:hypothetical protein
MINNGRNTSFSQRAQDLFAIHTAKKFKGTFLDFGCRGPLDINNTYLLEKYFNFSGLSFDIDSNEINKWKSSDRNHENAICCDLLNIENAITKMDDFYKSNKIDYFSFDLNPPLTALDVLKKFPFDKYKFGVVTYQHDFYRGFDTVKPSRDIFIKNGYRKVTKEHMKKFEKETPIWLSEDWWIHPDIVNVQEDCLDQVIKELTLQDLYEAGIFGFQ